MRIRPDQAYAGRFEVGHVSADNNERVMRIWRRAAAAVRQPPQNGVLLKSVTQTIFLAEIFWESDRVNNNATLSNSTARTMSSYLETRTAKTYAGGAAVLVQRYSG